MTREEFGKNLDALLDDIVDGYPIPEEELEGVRKAQTKLIKTLFKINETI
jgi:hypothetical protein